jgi:primosomal protein N' (replication factor Y)
MYIVEVTPFSKSIRNDSYSYFSSKPIKTGCIVTVPLRNRNVKGLVIDCRNGKNLKSELRSQDFAIKKIKGVSKDIFLRPEFIEAVEVTAEYFATSIGAIIESVVPKVVFEEIDKFKKINDISSKKIKKTETKSQKYVLQTEDSDRYSEYKSIIREKFAKNESVIFIVPTIEDCNIAEDKLSRGIEKDTFVLNSKTTKKKLLQKWAEINESEKPVLLIATTKFISLPISNIGMIIVERENSSAYRTQKMPYFDLRFFAETYAEKINKPFLYGDLMLRSETLKRYDDHAFFEFSPIKFRSIADAQQKIIDMKDEDEVSEYENPISNSLHKLIKENNELNDHLFILNNRKGLSPLVVCSDCGTIVKCEECESPVVLYGKYAQEKNNYFNCHFCGAKRGAGEKCVNCDSWKLQTVGFGTERIRREIQKQFPKAKILVLDKDTAKTAVQAKKIINDFYESPSAILVGTELAILYLHEPVENVAISSIDSMFSSPDFRVKERILNILLKARSKAKQNFLIQTRNKENKIFSDLRDGNLTNFYRNEFIERKKYNFPPFSLIIKISTSARQFKTAEKEISKIKETFKLDDMLIFQSQIVRNRGMKTAVGLLILDKEDWPNKDLVEKFKMLPPKFKLEIDAESLF